MNRLFLNPGLILVVCLPLLLSCAKNPAGNQEDWDLGDLTVLSCEPPLDKLLKACDTIAVRFAYRLPDRIPTNDSEYTFWLSFRADTAVPETGPGIEPSRTCDSCFADSRALSDTLVIRAPISELLGIRVQKKPLLAGISVSTSRNCDSTVQEGWFCFSHLDFDTVLRYQTGIDPDSDTCR
jgi:hypothetical protein